MPHTNRSGIRLHYRVAAPPAPSGAPVLLIMGFGFPGDAWQLQAEALATSREVAWFDNRGSGRSEAPRGLYSIAQLAADAVAVLDELGWEAAHVAGVSMGGMIAQELALAHPGRVRSLALIATSGGFFLPTPQGLWRLARANLTRGRGRYAALLDLLLPPEFLAQADREALAAGLAIQIGARPPLAGVAGQTAAVLGHHALERLKSAAAPPTLVLQPGRDILIPPRQSERLQRAVPGARLERLPAAGHGVLMQQPERVNELLAEHFQRTEHATGHSDAAVAGHDPGTHG